ncbi:unnamed protein product [Cuscuta campestris]|uniref:Replication factor A C-terminal domain-containing protein n=1 Tax=Cuscuta campestris TaxID=132261 RepID=A0A484MT68_9ASTE|nr:unnamed protein product [Cuscuta campestris]
MLAFFSKTDVKTVSTKGFPDFMCDLRSFESVREQPVLKDALLTDVIGKIVGRSSVRTYNRGQKEEKLMEMTLEDLEGERLTCTLWGKYVDQFNDYVNLDVPYPSVALISFCRVKRFNGVVSLCTAYDVTKIVYDGVSNEVIKFKSRLPDQGDDSTFTPTILSRVDDVESGTVTITSIKALLEEKEGYFWIKGEIDSLGPMRSWSYLGCTECNMKVHPEDARFKCDGCDKTIPHGVYKYKVIVRVVDESGSGHAAFVLFDKECTQLLGVSAFLLREAMVERNMDPDTIPQEMDRIMCQKALFKVHVKKQQGSPTKHLSRIFSVGQIVTDQVVLAKYNNIVERTNLDDFWESLEDLSETVEKIGSNDVLGSQSSCSASRKDIEIQVDDPIKRKLFEDDPSDKHDKRLKAIKLGLRKCAYLRQPPVVLGVGERDVEPIGVPFLDFGHEFGQGVAELALAGVEFQHRRGFVARQRRRKRALLRCGLFLRTRISSSSSLLLEKEKEY